MNPAIILPKKVNPAISLIRRSMHGVHAFIEWILKLKRSNNDNICAKLHLIKKRKHLYML